MLIYINYVKKQRFINLENHILIKRYIILQMVKEISSIIKTSATKEFRQLLQEADKTIDSYAQVVARAVGMNKEQVSSEIQAIYLDNLRKADEPQALLKENLVALMLKKQTSDYLKELIHKKALEKAEYEGDLQKIQEIEASMIEHLMINDFDLKVHKAINESVKLVKDAEPRRVSNNTNKYDDNMFFEVKVKDE